MMNEDQEAALQLCKEGHNVIITGQAGSGEIYVCIAIIEAIRALGKKVSVTCSTGISATHYGNLGASTLHKWSGVEDGRHLNEELHHLVSTDERFFNVKENIRTTDVLIIDEISMISAKTFSQVEFLCRNIRGGGLIFGGLQVILVGDFYQLPPVLNQLYGDSGKYCFLLPLFKSVFPHIVTLNMIHRQENVDLIKCINELETGHLSDESVAFLNSISRPLPINHDNQEPVHLFARNFDVDLFNYEKLQNMPGNLRIFDSKDEGSKHYLDKFLAPKHLGFKKMCPVILLKNLNDILVNGLRGTIIEMFEDSVNVKFEIGSKSLTSHLKACTFSTYDPIDKITLAKRTQLPLKLAFALTIHKSQGMSLDQNCYQPGQLGVAIGRAISVEGLQVLNFRKSLCKTHPISVTSFYESATLGYINPDLSCCRFSTSDNDGSELEDDDSRNDNSDNDGDEYNHDIEDLIQSFEVDSDFLENEIEYVSTLDHYDPCVLEVKDIIQRISCELKGTPAEDQIDHFEKCIEKDNFFFNEWFAKQNNSITKLFAEYFPDDKEKQDPQCIGKFYTAFQRYLSSWNIEH